MLCSGLYLHHAGVHVQALSLEAGSKRQDEGLQVAAGHGDAAQAGSRQPAARSVLVRFTPSRQVWTWPQPRSAAAQPLTPGTGAAACQVTQDG